MSSGGLFNMVELYYESSDGTKINLMGDGIYAQSPETLNSTSWSFNTISGVNGVGKVKRFYKETQEFPLDISIMADSEEDFNQIKYKLHQAFDRDIRRISPGRLIWNGYYKEVFAAEVSHSNFEELFDSVEMSIKFISVYPFWVKEKKFVYLKNVGDSGSLDYNFDFDNLDYGRTDFIELVKNDCIDKANFEIIFFGQALNPSVIINGHEYSLNTELKSGEYAVINSITKKITKHLINGETENIFYSRNRTSYVFEELPEGDLTLIRSKDFDLTVKVFDERSEPKWI